MAYGRCRSCPVVSPDKENRVTVSMCHPCNSREVRQNGKGASMGSVSHPTSQNQWKISDKQTPQKMLIQLYPTTTPLGSSLHRSSDAASMALLCWKSVLLLLLCILLHSFWSVQLGSAELPSTGIHSFGQGGVIPSCSFPRGSVCIGAAGSALQPIHIFTAFLSALHLIATAQSCVNMTLMLFYTILTSLPGTGKRILYFPERKGDPFPLKRKHGLQRVCSSLFLLFCDWWAFCM